MNKSMTWSLLLSLATATLLTAGYVAEADARGQRWPNPGAPTWKTNR